MLSRCVVVDDSMRFVQAARTVLGAGGLAVVAVATNRLEALHVVPSAQADVVLIDVALGKDSGVDLCLELLCAHPELAGRLILVSSHAADDMAELVEQSGAVGFVDKARLDAAAVRRVVGS